MKNNECTCNMQNGHRHPVIHLSEGTRMRRLANNVKLILPAIGLALIPKCPMCLAGYLALGTGIGLSVTTASYLRTGLILLCVLLIGYFVMKRLYRFLR